MVAVIIKSMKVGVLFLSVLGASAHAGLVKTSWLVEGDNRAVLHEETGIEWLNFGATVGLSIATVQSRVGAGGQFEGWRLPTYEEVQTMMSVFPNRSRRTQVSSWSNATYFNALNSSRTQFFSAFGYTGSVDSPFTPASSTFMYLNESGQTVRAGYQFRRYRSGSVSKPNYVAAYQNDSISNALYMSVSQHSIGEFSEAVFLVSDGGVTVSSLSDPSLNGNNPESPYATNLNASAPVLLLLGMLGLMGLRRKKA